MISPVKRLSSLFPFALLLSFLGGYMELVSLKGYGLFCAMQTGNTITLFVSLIDGDYMKALRNFLTILVFFAAIFFGAMLRKKYHAKALSFHSLSLLLGGLFLLGAFGLSYLGEGALPYLRSLLALYGASQVLAFERFDEERYVSTMMTMVLKNVAVHFSEGILEKDKKKVMVGVEFLLIFLSFVLGVAVGYLLYLLLPKMQDGYLLLAASLFDLLLLFPLSFLRKKEKGEETPVLA